MTRTLSESTGRFFVAAIALALALTAAFAVTPAAQAQANVGQAKSAASSLAAQTDDVRYYFSFDGAAYGGDYGIYGTPGEKMELEANLQYLDRETWVTVTVEDATIEWTNVAPKLNATASGNKLTINKLPKAGTYKFTATAYDADGNKLFSQTEKIVVKKSPALKIVKSSSEMGTIINLKNASWGWDNNTTKPFYTVTFKSLETGKTAVWNSKKGFTKNKISMSAGSIAGAGYPALIVQFDQSGKYKITAKLFHSDKQVATVSKTIAA